MKRILTPFVLSLLCLLSVGYSADIAIEPSGIYKTIDVRLANDTIKMLRGGKAKARAEVIKKITGSPENYAPPVLYLTSSILFEDKKRDEAMFWFYAGQLRGRIDANICADKTAGSAVGALNDMFGVPINKYAFKDVSKLKQTVEKVIEWEEKTECKYDRRWINLHGMRVFAGDTNATLSASKEDWDKIRKKTREEYRSSLYEVLESLNSKKP
jgi:hypothetical protein